jgi:hypothetical protein
MLDPTWLRPGLLAMVVDRLRVGLACLASARPVAPPELADGLEALGARIAAALGPLVAAQGARSLTPADLSADAGAASLPDAERERLPSPPLPVDAIQSAFDRGWTLIDDAMAEEPDRALLRHPSGATWWLQGEDDRIERTTLREGADAVADEVRWRLRPTDVSRRLCARVLGFGASAVDGLAALGAACQLRRLLTTDAGGGNAATVFEVVEQRPYDRRWVLAVVTTPTGQITGRYLLSREAAWDQRTFLEAAASADGARTRAAALAGALAAGLADALRAFTEPDADLAALSQVFRPEPGDAAAVFDEALAAKIEPRMLAAWADDPPTLSPGQPGADVRVQVATGGMLAEGLGCDAFPRGWSRVAAQLAPASVWAVVTFARPGAPDGRSYDGLCWCRGRWVWFPKAWRMAA